MTATIPTLLAEVASGPGLPERPDPALDRYLDAAAECVARYGWSRTSPKDIAREAGVERTTVYRYLGPKDNILRLLVAREIHGLITRTVEVAFQEERGPHMVVELLASAVEYALANPLISKLIDDEPELAGRFLAEGVPDTLDRFTTALSPVVAAGMQAGYIATRDPVIVTEWIVRIGLSLLTTPAPVDLRLFLSEVLTPLLEPTDAAR